MSNSVSRFIFDNTPCEYTHSSYFLLAYNSDYKVNIVFDTIRDTKVCVDNRITNECLYVELTKDQITHLLSLDCPDAFIAYALTLCPLSPESSISFTRCVVCTDKELTGGNLLSVPPKQDVTYLDALKDIKAQIEFLNKCAFDKSILTSDEHFALLAIEEELQQLIHFDPIRPTDDGLPLRYDLFSIVNGSQLPDNLE